MDLANTDSVVRDESQMSETTYRSKSVRDAKKKGKNATNSIKSAIIKIGCDDDANKPSIHKKPTNPYQAPQDRMWEKKWNAYVRGEGEEPGPHKDPNHPWNLNKEQFKQEKGMD